MRRISVSNRRNGVNSPPDSVRGDPHPGVLPEFDDRRILPAPGVGELGEPLQSGLLGRRRADRLQRLGDLVPVLAGGIAERVSQQVHDAGLHDGPRPDGLHCLGQALEPVADEHEDVVHAAVLDLGEDVQPVFGALTAVAGPQPGDLPPALDGDGKGHVDGPVGDRAIADLHVDGVDEHDRIDRVEGSALPFGHALQHLVGDGGDGLAGDLGAIDLGQVGLDFTCGQALRGQRDDHLVNPGQALLPFLDDLRLERAIAVTGHRDLHRTDVGQHRLGAFAVA
ncbi:hypothetical protein SUDANB176_00321 [Streptomyces sp. enrichment culture]